MSALKEFDRIALVLAFIAILPGFNIGYTFHRSEFGVVGVERPTSGITRMYTIPSIDEKYIPPPVPISIAVGLSSAFASFLIVLFGIRFGMRGGIKLYKWITECFRDDSSKDK